MFRAVTLVISIIFTFSACSIHASESRKSLEESLYQAEGFLSVAPERSYEILTKESVIDALRENDQLRWHMALSRASRSQRDYKQMQNSLELALGMSHTADFQKELPTLLDTIGVLLRNKGNVEGAKLCYLCALKYPTSNQDKISILGNYSIALIHENDFVAAQKVITVAKNLALGLPNKVQIAKLENGLGVIAFELEDFAAAITHLKASFQIHQEVSKRDSIIIVGINLLLTAVMINDNKLYERLHPTISRLVNNSQSKAIEASLFWVDSAFQKRQNVVIDEQWKNQLQSSFQNLANDRIKALYKEHLATKLGVTINFDMPTKATIVNQELPDFLKNFEQCDWEYLQTLPEKTIESMLLN